MSKSIYFIALIGMTIVSFSTFFGLHIAGISVMIGIIFFFISRTSKGKLSSNDELNLNSSRENLKKKSIWLWLILPTIMNVICFSLAILFLPEFMEHLYNRTTPMISVDKLLFLILQLAILALGEEIAWRGFFQKQLNKWLPITPALILTSIAFSFGHFVSAPILVASYDMFFIFLNSMLYGILFYKTNNLWLSASSHFIANLFSIIFIIVI